MMVILALKGMCEPHNHKKTIISLLMIQLERASDKHVGGPQGANVSDGTGRITVPDLKALASVGNISGSCGSGWEKFVGPRSLLGKFGRTLDV